MVAAIFNSALFLRVRFLRLAVQPLPAKSELDRFVRRPGGGEVPCFLPDQHRAASSSQTPSALTMRKPSIEVRAVLAASSLPFMHSARRVENAARVCRQPSRVSDCCYPPWDGRT
jgi:hypothetical protein